MNNTSNSLATLFLFLMISTSCAHEIKWIGESPEMMMALEGRGWDDIGFNRFPDAAESKVRPAVWNLSKNTAGLMLRFTSDSPELHVSYALTGNVQMPHMPTTGVSGVDLYTKDKAGNWRWVRGTYSFGEKVSYKFLLDNKEAEQKEFYLFLPVYNGVKGLEIGLPENKKLTFTPARTEKPILVYGTSIAQGACASRAGMAWVNIVAREMNRPMINLGFSGNGRMESEVIDLITEIDPAIFVLDCLPNLTPTSDFSPAEIKEKLLYAVNTIRSKYPDTPILLTEHAGYSDGMVFESRAIIYEDLNDWMRESYDKLQAAGVKQLYTLTKDEIGLGTDDFVDGTHPSDLGMSKYAAAYSKKLKEIL